MTQYSEDKGLKDGLPDPDWALGPIRIYPTHRRADNAEPGWVGRLAWGDTWGECEFGYGSTPAAALVDVIAKGKQYGCPDWLDHEGPEN